MSDETLEYVLGRVREFCRDAEAAGGEPAVPRGNHTLGVFGIPRGGPPDTPAELELRIRYEFPAR